VLMQEREDGYHQQTEVVAAAVVLPEQGEEEVHLQSMTRYIQLGIDDNNSEGSATKAYGDADAARVSHECEK